MRVCVNFVMSTSIATYRKNCNPTYIKVYLNFHNLCYESMSTSIAEFETKYIRLNLIYINFVMPTYINFVMSTSIAKFETNYSILMSVYVNFVMLTSIAEYEKNVFSPSLKFILTLCMSTSIISLC